MEHDQLLCYSKNSLISMVDTVGKFDKANRLYNDNQRFLHLAQRLHASCDGGVYTNHPGIIQIKQVQKNNYKLKPTGFHQRKTC
jgi:hypothetical protein